MQIQAEVMQGPYRPAPRSHTFPEWWTSPTLPLCPSWPSKYILKSMCKSPGCRVSKYLIFLQLITLQVSVTCHASSSSSSSPPRRAAEKLSLTLRKKGQASDSAPAHLSTRFRDIIQKNPPSVPSCLLQAATRTRDSPNVGKVDSEASNSIRCTGEVCCKWPTFFLPIV